MPPAARRRGRTDGLHAGPCGGGRRRAPERVLPVGVDADGRPRDVAHGHGRARGAFLPSVCGIWKTAEIKEREAYDFFGIRFTGHPDMRRLYLREDWAGYPLRKDYDMDGNPLDMENEENADVTEEYDLRPDGTIERRENVVFRPDDFIVNIGPQHPSTHGVLRMRTSLDGETVKKVDPILGYIHRGIEKMNESLTYPQTLALTDRLDYLSAHQSRHALCMCIEGAAGIEVSRRAIYPHDNGRIATYRFPPPVLFLSGHGHGSADAFLLWLPGA